MALFQSSQVPSLNHPERTHVASCQEGMPESSSKTETLELICPFPELSSPSHHPHWPPVTCLKCKTNHATLELNILRWLPITFTRKSTFTWSARPFMIWPLPTPSVSSTRISSHALFNVLPCSLHARWSYNSPNTLKGTDTPLFTCSLYNPLPFYICLANAYSTFKTQLSHPLSGKFPPAWLCPSSVLLWRLP